MSTERPPENCSEKSILPPIILNEGYDTGNALYAYEIRLVRISPSSSCRSEETICRSPICSREDVDSVCSNIKNRIKA